MDKVDREKLLSAMQAVQPGLTQKELIEQSSCIVFHQGRIWTFNEEIACSAPSPLGDFTGAVTAKPLMELLSKMDEKELDITASPDGTEFRIVGSSVQDAQGKKIKRRAKFAFQAQVLLPIGAVDTPQTWYPLPKAPSDNPNAADFGSAVRHVAACASTNSKEFLYSCIHIKKAFMEACDRLQIGRYNMPIPIESDDVLVRATSLAQIASVGVDEMSETASWLHFRNIDKGVILSCRKFVDNYADLERFVQRDGSSKLTLPPTLDGILSRAGIFSAAASVGSFVIVDLRPGETEATATMTITGEGPFGRYDEQRSVEYNGKDAIRFLIAPQLLSELSKKSTVCHVVPGKLFSDDKIFSYFTCTNSPDLLKPAETKTAAA